jgi:hypothetical protein
MTRVSGAALGLGKPILLAQLVDEPKALTEPLEVQSGEIEFALRRGKRLSLAEVGPAHGNGCVGAIGQAQAQVGVHATADEDDLTSLAPKGMMRMSDGDRFQRRLGKRGSVLWVSQPWKTGLYKRRYV